MRFGSQNATQPAMERVKQAVERLAPGHMPAKYEGITTEQMIMTLGDVEYKRDAYAQKIERSTDPDERMRFRRVWNALTLIATDLVHELKERGEVEALERIFRPNGIR